MMKVAVVADIHLHDLHGGYGWIEEGSGGIALRTLEETMASTRVFNESHAAFLAVLDDIVQRNIRDVVLLGDYSDDGQPGAVNALKQILSFYEDEHGLRFFATFGNHDCFGPARRPQAKRLTKADGGTSVLIGSDAKVSTADIIRPGMVGMSKADAMEAMAAYGLTRQRDVLHWETPFPERGGLQQSDAEDDDPGDHDASYLVEPQEGLWLLILDANVFYRRDGQWQVRADAAWDHVLAQRPYLTEWIADVVARAYRMGKTLLAFSHYPALPLIMTGEGRSRKVACTPDWATRMPSLESGRILAGTGLRWHFSGHMHVAGRIEHEGFVNVAVPSPVAYPGGYAAVACGHGTTDCEFVRLKDAPGFDISFASYARQAQQGQVELAYQQALGAEDYASFLRAHQRAIIAYRHIPSDWPAALREKLGVTLPYLLDGVPTFGALIQRWPEIRELRLADILEDYYFMRSGGADTIRALPEQRLSFYRHWGQEVRAGRLSEPGMDQLAVLLAALL